MTYSVKEIYYTIQGEGAQTGRPAVFCRFAGCNLWTGLEKDRAKAVCKFCDTDFVDTDAAPIKKFNNADDLAKFVLSLWPEDETHRLVVCTGGEPLLQLDEALVQSFHAHDFEVAVETNGTIAAPSGIDWICVSPKANASLKQLSGQELKLVFPQKEKEAQPVNFEDLNFDHFFLQPMDGPKLKENTKSTIDYCLTHPNWGLSIQTHKVIGID